MNQSWLGLAWLCTVIATAGSLFFSEIMGLPPCVLCWYQRIAMYPLVLILGTAWLLQDCRGFQYSISLLAIGLAIAIYHNLLYYGVLPDSAAPCTRGVSCTTRHILWWDWLSIPLLSLIGFVSVAGCLGLAWISKGKNTT